jgi:PST family polysaccharide transporter
VVARPTPQDDQAVPQRPAARRIIENFISLVVLRGFDLLIPLITLPYLVRVLGIERFGLLSFVQSAALYAGALVQYGFGITATREVARHRDDPVRLAAVYSQTLATSGAIAAVAIVLWGCLLSLVPALQREASVYWWTMVFVIGQSVTPVWFFQGLERMRFIAGLALLSKFLYLVLLLLFVRSPADYALVPFSNAIAIGIGLCVAMWLARYRFGVRMSKPTMRIVADQLRSGRDAFVSQFAPTLYNNTATFLLGVAAGNVAVGAYSAASKLIDACSSLGYVLSNVFLPPLAREIAWHRTFRNIMLGTAILLTVVLMLVADDVVAFLFGAESSHVSQLVIWLSPCIVAIFMYLTFSANFLMLIGKEAAAKDISLYVSLVAFGVALVVVPTYGAFGAVFVVVLARVAMAVFAFVAFRRWRWQA